MMTSTVAIACFSVVCFNHIFVHCILCIMYTIQGVAFVHMQYLENLVAYNTSTARAVCTVNSSA